MLRVLSVFNKHHIQQIIKKYDANYPFSIFSITLRQSLYVELIL